MSPPHQWPCSQWLDLTSHKGSHFPTPCGSFDVAMCAFWTESPQRTGTAPGSSTAWLGRLHHHSGALSVPCDHELIGQNIWCNSRLDSLSGLLDSWTICCLLCTQVPLQSKMLTARGIRTNFLFIPTNLFFFICFWFSHMNVRNVLSRATNKTWSDEYCKTSGLLNLAWWMQIAWLGMTMIQDTCSHPLLWPSATCCSSTDGCGDARLHTAQTLTWHKFRSEPEMNQYVQLWATGNKIHKWNPAISNQY